ncbi:unnamed protein product, partial [Prorocentrum cordatum]
GDMASHGWHEGSWSSGLQALHETPSPQLPSPAGGGSLEAALERLKLLHFLPRLRGLGVEVLGDVGDLLDADLGEGGMPEHVLSASRAAARAAVSVCCTRLRVGPRGGWPEVTRS